MEYVRTHLADPMVPRGKIGTTPIADGDAEDAQTATCDVCSEEHTFLPDKHYPVKAIACKTCKPDWIPSPPPLKPKVVSETKKTEPRPETCEGCGGPKSRRGYKHEPGCSAVKARQEDRTAAIKAAKPVKVCDACGGPQSGKGFTHEPDCAIIKAQEEKANKPTETCKACGGPKRGRGFTHTDDCSAKVKPPVKAKVKPASKKRPMGTRRPRL